VSHDVCQTLHCVERPISDRVAKKVYRKCDTPKRRKGKIPWENVLCLAKLDKVANFAQAQNVAELLHCVERPISDRNSKKGVSQMRCRFCY